VLIELGMDRDRVSHLTLSEWKNAFAHLFRQMKSDLQDAITCLRRVPLTDTVAVIKGHKEFYVGNYRSLLTYLAILEEYRVEVQMLTGIKCQLAKPEPALLRNGGSSTVWQVVREKVDQQLVQLLVDAPLGSYNDRTTVFNQL